MRRHFALICLTLTAFSCQASTYYVSTQGKDTNPGSSVSPWRTIQHACQRSLSGDTVLVSSGVFNELVTVLHPMTLKNAPGAKPIIDGSGLAVPPSNAGLVLINGISNVILQGFEIRNFKTTNSNLVPAGIFVEGLTNEVTIKGNLIHDIENDGSNSASINAFGIAVYGNSPKGAITNLNIEQNEIRNTKTGNSETVTVNGNVNGFQVIGNLVHDVNNIGIDCIGFEGASPIKGQDQARNGYVGLNTVFNVTSVKNPAYGGSPGADGIYVDGGTSIVIERNVVHNADIGIEVTSEHLGKVASNVIVRSNLVYSSNVVGLSIGGYDSRRGGTTNCTFVNNTFYANDTTNSGAGEFAIQFYTKGNVFKNNILCASSQGVLISEDTGAGVPGVVSDYNLYFTTANPTWNWSTGSFTDLASFAHASHGDSHSKFENPDFINAAGLNFRLANGSAAINAGSNLGPSIEGPYDLGGSSRLIGKTVDIGSYESAAPVP